MLERLSIVAEVLSLANMSTIMLTMTSFIVRDCVILISVLFKKVFRWKKKQINPKWYFEQARELFKTINHLLQPIKNLLNTWR